MFTFAFSLIILPLNNYARLDAEPLFSIKNFLFLFASFIMAIWLASSRLSVCEFNKYENKISVLRACWFRKRLEIYNLSDFVCVNLTKEKSIYGISFSFSDGTEIDFLEKALQASISRAECIFILKEVSAFLQAL